MNQDTPVNYVPSDMSGKERPRPRNYPIEINVDGKSSNLSVRDAQKLIEHLTEAVAELELTEFEKQVDIACQYVCDRETLAEASRILMDVARKELEKKYELIVRGSTHSNSFDRGFEFGKQQGKAESEAWRPSPEQIDALVDAVDYCSYGALFLNIQDLRSLLHDLKNLIKS